MSAVGVDIGGTNVRVLVEGAGSPITAQVASSAHDLVELIAELVARSGVLTPTTTCVGLPGRTTSRVPAWIPLLPYLNEYPLAEAIEQRLGGRCVLALDGHLTLEAEMAYGAAVGTEDAVLMAVGSGVGGAIAVRGKVVNGRHGTAGSFGWLPGAVPAVRPTHGSFEKTVGGRALESAAAVFGSVPTLLKLASSGAPEAKTLVDSYAEQLGSGLAAVASILDPEVVILGGGLVKAFPQLQRPLTAAFRNQASPSVVDTPLVPAALGDRAGAIGALHRAQKDDLE